MLDPGRVVEGLKGLKTDGGVLYEVMGDIGKKGKLKDVKGEFLRRVGEGGKGAKKDEDRREKRWKKAASELSLLGLMKKGFGGKVERDAMVWTK